MKHTSTVGGGLAWEPFQKVRVTYWVVRSSEVAHMTAAMGFEGNWLDFCVPSGRELPLGITVVIERLGW